MANHAVARASQGNKMKTKLTGKPLWELRDRQFQRLYYAEPKHKNRDLITAEHLARAKLLQPDYALLAAVEGDKNDEEDDNDDETTQEEA
ncbi:hypothetical protein K4K52_003588 [Colletotrichum sp. SAR 10_76]|nr:hypothetical protein K4K51_012136 [Colletotrichum sp. SAR 10_75]KAI8205944.1 hypothetical protein K4K52_003588 [Colletotrichum sp. SAR 10_76]